MSFLYLFEIILIGIGLSMDAFAVSIALSTAESKRFSVQKSLATGFFFGFFQALMPLMGWIGGSLCGVLIQTCGKYLAAALLGFIGGKMIYDRNKENKVNFNWKTLILLSFATSIDAFLVGVSFACLDKPSVLWESIIIGITTFLISCGGCFFGRICGNIFGNKCEWIGGLTLILIGVKILIFG